MHFDITMLTDKPVSLRIATLASYRNKFDNHLSSKTRKLFPELKISWSIEFVEITRKDSFWKFHKCSSFSMGFALWRQFLVYKDDLCWNSQISVFFPRHFWQIVMFSHINLYHFGSVQIVYEDMQSFANPHLCQMFHDPVSTGVHHVGGIKLPTRKEITLSQSRSIFYLYILRYLDVYIVSWYLVYYIFFPSPVRINYWDSRCE